MRGQSGPRPGPVNRKKKNAAAAPEAGTEPIDAVPGHNEAPEEMSDADKQVLLLMNLKVVKEKRALLASATSALRDSYKKARADGFTKKEIDEAIDLRSDDGEKKAKVRIDKTLFLARLLGMPIGAKQMDLFARDDVPADDKAFEQGRIAGIEGLHASSPYAPGLPQHERWMEGWHSGQADLHRRLEQMPKPAQIPDAEFDRLIPHGNA